MSGTTWFPERWPASDPDVIQLYSLATQNGQKVSVALEEMGLAYEPHRIDIGADDQFDPDYLKLSPNGKIPTIIDPHGPEDEAIIVMESVAILIYLADKTGRFLPQNYRSRMEHLQWLFFQAAHIGPMFGQFGHFHRFARDKTSDDYARTRYTNEAKRLLLVLDQRLADRQYLMGEYSIVDMATAPWVGNLETFYKGGEVLELASFSHVMAWWDRVSARPAYQRGITVCA